MRWNAEPDSTSRVIRASSMLLNDVNCPRKCGKTYAGVCGFGDARTRVAKTPARVTRELSLKSILQSLLNVCFIDTVVAEIICLSK
jgi:hypothetical protein